MEPEMTSTAPGADTSDDAVGNDADPDSVITDAESVLDNLLEVVRSQAEEILATARAEADEAAKVIRADALASVEAAITELSAVDGYRNRLVALAASLRSDDTKPSGPQTSDHDDGDHDDVDRDKNAALGEPGYVEVDPEALQMLAGELGVKACRDVVDTFLAELIIQLDYLTEASGSDDRSTKKVGRVLHNLSSGCATVGAYEVAELCNEITPDTLAAHIEQLFERGNRVYDEVKQISDDELDGIGDDAGAGEDAG